jgi:hypothetical protein
VFAADPLQFQSGVLSSRLSSLCEPLTGCNVTSSARDVIGRKTYYAKFSASLDNISRIIFVLSCCLLSLSRPESAKKTNAFPFNLLGQS